MEFLLIQSKCVCGSPIQVPTKPDPAYIQDQARWGMLSPDFESAHSLFTQPKDLPEDLNITLFCL